MVPIMKRQRKHKITIAHKLPAKFTNGVGQSKQVMNLTTPHYPSIQLCVWGWGQERASKNTTIFTRDK